MSRELPDVQAGFKKGRGTRDQIVNICWIIEKAREFQKSIYFCLIYYAKVFGCVDHNKLWKILQKMGISDNLTCLLRNLYTGQQATVRTGHGTTDWFQTGKGVRQGCILSPCLFNFYAEHIMRNVGLDETQAGISISRRTSISVSIDNAKPLTTFITTNWGKFLKRWEYQTILPASWDLYEGQEATVRTGHGTPDWFKIEKGVFKAEYCDPTYLTYMQNTSCKMLGWMNHKQESRLPGEMSTTSDTLHIPQMIPLIRWKRN